VTSTSLSVVFSGSVWILVWFFGSCLPAVLRRVSSLFRHVFVKGWRVELVSVSDVINFGLGQVIISSRDVEGFI